MTSQDLNSLKQHIRKTLYLHSKYHQICLNLIKPSYADHVLHTLSPSVQNFLTYILEPSSPKYYDLTDLKIHTSDGHSEFTNKKFQV